jgi:hypothetical protein
MFTGYKSGQKELKKNQIKGKSSGRPRLKALLLLQAFDFFSPFFLPLPSKSEISAAYGSRPRTGKSIKKKKAMKVWRDHEHGSTS